MPVSRRPETVHLWGETLCLNYANSVDWSPEDEHVDPEQTDVLRAEDMLSLNPPIHHTDPSAPVMKMTS